MLADKTLIIVGAGASSEFGLPLGWQLRDQIRSALQYPPANDRISKGAISQAISLYAKQAGIGERDLHSLRHQIARALPLAGSIDSYIEAHQHDRHIAFLGKLAIAACLLDAERESALYLAPRNGGGLDFAGLTARTGTVGAPWLMKLFQIIADSLQRKDVENIFADLFIVCFNYDRCIQQFLRHAVATYFEIPFEKASEIVYRMNIIHPYGFLGHVSKTVPFGGDHRHVGDLGAEALIEAASRLNTYSEYIEDQKIVAANRQVMSSSQTAAFIGFAYHRQNVKLLASMKPSGVRRALATVRGISASDQNHVRAAISNCMVKGGRPMMSEHVLFDGFCSDFFDEFRLTLSRR